MRVAAFAACLLLAAGPAAAVPIADRFSAVFVFGDSLSDPGNLFAASGGTFPPPPYDAGRFSNGPVWAEVLTAEAQKAGLPTVNAAYGFATAVPDADGIPDLPLQIGGFALSGLPAVQGPNALAAVFFGANDLFAALDALAPGDAPDLAVAEAAADAVAAGVQGLAGLGVGSFLTFLLPDLGQTPEYTLVTPDLSDEATALTDAFNARLSVSLGALSAGGLEIATVDLNMLFAGILADPAGAGYALGTTPCILPFVNADVCDLNTADERVFWDHVHPSAAIHRDIADAAFATLGVVPVPLPGALPLLAAALGLGALLRRRG